MNVGEHAGLQTPVPVGKLDPHLQGAAVGLGCGQDRRHPAGEHIAGEGREFGSGGRSHPDLAGKRFGHGGGQPHGREAGDLRQGLAHCHRHPRAHIQGLDGAADRRGDSDDAVSAPGLGHLVDQAVGHPQQPQSLAGRPFKRGIAARADGQVFGLCAPPAWDQQVGDGGAGGHDVARRSGVDPLDKACRARLDDGDVALVEVEHAGDVEALGELPALHARQPHAEALSRRRVDLHARAAGRAFIGVLGRELHIHEWGLARSVEVLLGPHGVVPVEDWSGARRGRC